MKILSLNYMNASLATMIRSFELARALAARGHQVTLVYMHPRFRPPASFREHLDASAAPPGFTIRHASQDDSARADATAPPRGEPGKITEARPTVAGLARQAAGSLGYLPRELALLRGVRPDVLVARPDHVLSFPIAARLSGTPLVIDTDGPVEELDFYWGIRSRWFRGLDLARARAAAAILHVSRVCGDLWRRKGIPEERLFLCPNGADPARFRPLAEAERLATRRSLGLEGCRVIAFSGNQRTWHGVGDLLAAAAPILRQAPDVRILVIGQIEDESALRLPDLGEDLLRGRVTFTGPVPYQEMPRLLDAADVAALPYPALELFHFSPMKMFEALAMGKVLVAPAQGQIGEILEKLPSAMLYDPGRRGALESALRRGLDLPPGSGLAGRGLLEAGHTWARRAGTVERACEFAVGPGRRGRRAGGSGR